MGGFIHSWLVGTMRRVRAEGVSIDMRGVSHGELCEELFRGAKNGRGVIR